MILYHSRIEIVRGAFTNVSVSENRALTNRGRIGLSHWQFEGAKRLRCEQYARIS